MVHHIPIGPRVRAPANEAGEVGSIPAWGELNELLVIAATSDNAQIEITHMGLFQGLV